MAGISVTIDASSFARAAGLLERESLRVERDLRLLTQRASSRAVKAMERATPISQPQGDEPEHVPHMRDLWHQQPTGPLESVVFNDAAYSVYQFTGTRSHFVGPVHGQALRFFEGGGAVFSRGHEVSGITPNAKLLRALDSQMLKAEADLFDYGVGAMERLAREIR